MTDETLTTTDVRVIDHTDAETGAAFVEVRHDASGLHKFFQLVDGLPQPIYDTARARSIEMATRDIARALTERATR